MSSYLQINLILHTRATDYSLFNLSSICLFIDKLKFACVCVVGVAYAIILQKYLVFL